MFSECNMRQSQHVESARNYTVTNVQPIVFSLHVIGLHANAHLTDMYNDRIISISLSCFQHEN